MWMRENLSPELIGEIGTVLLMDETQGVLLADAEGKYVAANVYICDLLCYSPDRLFTMHVDDLSSTSTSTSNRTSNALDDTSRTYLDWNAPIPNKPVYCQRTVYGNRGHPILVQSKRCRLPSGYLLELIRTTPAEYSPVERLGVPPAEGLLGTWQWDLSSGRVYWSAECYEIMQVNHFGGTMNAFIYLVHPEDRGEFVTTVTAAVESRTISTAHNAMVDAECRIVCQNGEARWMSITGQIRHNGGGSPGHVVGMVRDIHQRKEAELQKEELSEQLRQSQKMESIGRLAGGIAHDFNNLLTVIQMYSEHLNRELADQPRAAKQTEQILLATQRATHLTSQLLAFSRKQLVKPTILDPNTLIIHLNTMLERLIGEDIQLLTRFEKELPPICVDRGQIEQVLVNIVVNARDAMPNGGVLLIRTRTVQGGKNGARGTQGLSEGTYVLISISDTGHGMDKECRDQIFEPFFTTKPNGLGTGLGLSTVHGIVTQSGGHIKVYSKPKQGTTFHIYLPASAEPVAEPELAPGIVQSAARPGGSERILVVEDAPAVRTLLATTLTECGYRVLTAPDGATALAKAELQSDPIDLLLTDVVMPQMNGRALAEQLKATRPLLNVLFMSGYTDDEILKHGVRTRDVEILSKPFSTNELLEKVRTMLDRAPALPAREEDAIDLTETWPVPDHEVLWESTHAGAPSAHPVGVLSSQWDQR